MSNHRKSKRTPRMSAGQYVTSGVGGAAMVGVGVFLATPPGEPTTPAPAVQLASFGSPLAPLPLGPVTDWWLLDGDGSSTRSAAQAAPAGLGSGALFGLIGPGGLLIGNGRGGPGTGNGGGGPGTPGTGGTGPSGPDGGPGGGGGPGGQAGPGN